MVIPTWNLHNNIENTELEWHPRNREDSWIGMALFWEQHLMVVHWQGRLRSESPPTSIVNKRWLSKSQHRPTLSLQRYFITTTMTTMTVQMDNLLCHICRNMYNNMENLKRHLKNHTNSYNCPECKYSSLRKETPKHIKTRCIVQIWSPNTRENNKDRD